MLLLNLLVYLIVSALVLWLIVYLVGMLAPQFTQPARVVCGVVFIIICLYALVALIGGAPLYGPHLFRG